VTEGPIGLFGRAFALRHDLPLVTSFHTDFPRYAAHYLGKHATEPVRGYLRWFHRRALATQTPSAATRYELQQMGIPQAIVWGGAVDSRRFTPSLRSETRRAEMGCAGRWMVLHVGRLAVEKDPATLVESFRQAHAALGEAAIFCVAGAGPEADSVQRALPFARHFGFLSRERLAELYADADLFVFPSPTETCGLVALEAMASGLPVIGAGAGGIRESIMPGITGHLIEPGNASRIRHGDSIAGKGSGKTGSDGTGSPRLRAGQGLVSGIGPTRGALQEGEGYHCGGHRSDHLAHHHVGHIVDPEVDPRGADQECQAQRGES
jgi:Glycosyltransferase